MGARRFPLPVRLSLSLRLGLRLRLGLGLRLRLRLGLRLRLRLRLGLRLGIAQAKWGLKRTSVGHVKGTTAHVSPKQTREDPLDADLPAPATHTRLTRAFNFHCVFARTGFSKNVGFFDENGAQKYAMERMGAAAPPASFSRS